MPDPAERTLPQCRGAAMVTDGGLETDLIFHHRVDLPHFAAFPLLDTEHGRALLDGYFTGYAAVAQSAGAGLVLESATWRANPDWGDRLGYDAAALARVNAAGITTLAALRDRYAGTIDELVISGSVGPRGDGYRPGPPVDPAAAARYHHPQVEALAGAGADLVTAYTLLDTGEAVGIARAARATGIAVAISFTVEKDGRLADGTTIAQAIGIVDDAEPPDYYLLNCAHPTHIARGLSGTGTGTGSDTGTGTSTGTGSGTDTGTGTGSGTDTKGGAWRGRIAGLRYNASAHSHAELDESAELDEGDAGALAVAHEQLAPQLPALTILGGCCGTDVRHVAALWRVPVPA